MNFYTDNTLSAIGNYRIVTFTDPYTRVDAITAAVSGITGGSTGAKVDVHFRYSTDNTSWSLWIDVADIATKSFDPDEYLYLEFKYTAADDPLVSPSLAPGDDIIPEFVISSLDVTVSTVASTADPYEGFNPAGRCSDEYCQIPIVKQDKFTFDPYAVNNALCLYQELSSMTNEMFGHEVVYYRVNPQARSADVVLKEWTIFNVDQKKCVKVLVPNNEFPDSKPMYNTFGIDFEIPFEVHIDKTYWDNNFGQGTMPQELDVVYFPLLNRIYEVKSSYVYRDFMQQPLYFKAQLVKYAPRPSVQLPTNIATELDDLTINTDELFEEETEREVKRVTKPEQYVTVTHQQDPTRAQVYRTLPIDKYDLYNHWTLMADTFYDLDTLYAKSGDVEAVIYRQNADMAANESRAITMWFNPQKGSTTAQVRPLINGTGTESPITGLNVDLVYSLTAGASIVRLTHNGTVVDFPITGAALADDKWYGLVVNVSNQFAQAGVNLWERTEGSVDMTLLHSEVKDITAAAFDADRGWRLKSSPIYITNVRVFGRMLPEEKQNLVLSQYIVADSDEALVIDNARPILRLPRITNPK